MNVRTVGAVATAALYAAAWPSAGAQASARPAAGQLAPALQTATLDGGDFDLGALKGKVVIVSLWATWCAPCRLEMPALEALYRRHRAQGLEVIGLSIDAPRNAAKVRAAFSGVSFPAALFAKARVNGFESPRALPLAYVIDRKGVVRAVLGVNGMPVDEAALNAAIAPLLAS